MKKVSLLGPKGTFTHQVFTDNFEEHLPVFVDTIRDVFENVPLTTHLGIVPIENSIGGTVGMTLDCLLNSSLKIIQEILLPISHNLSAHTKNLKQIKKLFTHTQSYSQCEIFIRKYLPHVEIIHTTSNSQSAKMLAKSNKDHAAIIPKISAMMYSLPIIKSNIQDNENNMTRFIVISNKESKPTDNDRTSMSIHPKIDKPGLLYDILGSFAKINLTKIESRPSRGKLGDYIFFIEFIGNLPNDVLSELKKIGDIRIFGSYPKKY